jgi:hypothetical protein
MKKLIVIAFLLIIFIFSGYKANAISNDYVNLLDMNQIQYDEMENVFYSNQKIELRKNLPYTLVASANFFGENTKVNPNALINGVMGTRFISYEGKTLFLDLILNYSGSGMYYSTVIPKEDCSLEITDFLTKGYTHNNLPKNEIQLFLGEKEQFQGFRENEYLDDYMKVSDTINIYSDCINPITVEEITSKLRVYDNNDGFYDVFTIVSDTYQNTNAVGVYEIVYQALDQSENSVLLSVVVHILDRTPPIITGPDVIEFDCFGSVILPEEVFRQCTAYDAVDGDLTSKIYVESSGLGRYQQGIIKDYSIILAVKDKSGNKCTKEIIAKAKDLFAPTLEVKDIELPLSQLGNTLFESFFDQLIEVVTDNSKHATIEYAVGETLGEFGFTGRYEVYITAKDESGNSVTKKAYITIIDDIAPEFYMHIDLIETTTDEVYSIEDIKNAISDKLAENGILYNSLNLVSCDYINNENKAGNYLVKFAYSFNGETNYMVGTINVNEPPQQTYYCVLLLILVPIILAMIVINKKRENSY